VKSFEQFVSESAQQGHVNLLFEKGMYSLAEDLERILQLFAEAGVPFELIGGLAVNAHLMAASERSRSFLTRDIDVLVRRSDLDAIMRAAKLLDFEPKRMLGGYALIGPGQELWESVHMLFVGEKPKSTYPVQNPDLNPEGKDLFGLTIPVAPLRDLLILKLNSLRPKDVVHLEVLDQVGFITLGLEQSLPAVLRARLEVARRQFDTETDE
jgi:hypothetical protein